MELKNLLGSVILGGILWSLPIVARNRVVTEKESEGCPIEIGIPEVEYSRLYNDTLNLGSGERNWGYFDEIAKYKGRPVKMGYDYHSLNHCLTLGDEVMIADISLHLQKRDSVANKVVFRRGNSKIELNFNEDHAFDKIKNFCRAPKGWDREKYVYVLLSKNPEIVFNNLRRVYEADIPTDMKLRKSLLDLIKIENPCNPVGQYGDSVIVVKKDISSLRDIMEKNAEEEILNHYDYPVKGGTPNQLFGPMGGCNDVIAFDFVWDSPQYLTIKQTHNATYVAGGGRSSEDIYYTYDKKVNRWLKENDFMTPEKKKKLISLLPEYIVKEETNLDENGNRYYSLEEIKDAFTLTNAEDLPLHIAIVGEEMIIGYPGEMLTQFGEDGNWNVSLPLNIIK